jgi:hypothetical protein
MLISLDNLETIIIEKYPFSFACPFHNNSDIKKGFI